MTQHDELLARLDGKDRISLADQWRTRTLIREKDAAYLDLSAKLEAEIADNTATHQLLDYTSEKWKAERKAREEGIGLLEECLAEIRHLTDFQDGVDNKSDSLRHKVFDFLDANKDILRKYHVERALQDRLVAKAFACTAAESRLATVFERTRERCAAKANELGSCRGPYIAEKILALQPEGEESAAAQDNSPLGRAVRLARGSNTPPSQPVKFASDFSATALIPGLEALQLANENDGELQRALGMAPFWGIGEIIFGAEVILPCIEKGWFEDRATYITLTEVGRAEIERLRNSDNGQAAK